MYNVYKEEEKDALIDTLSERNAFLESIDDAKNEMKLLYDNLATGGTIHYIIKRDPQIR